MKNLHLDIHVVGKNLTLDFNYTISHQAWVCDVIKYIV